MLNNAKARRIVLAAMLLSAFMAAMEGTVTGAIMPVVVGAIGGFELFSWTFGAYLLVAREAPDLGAVDELMREGEHSPLIALALDHGLSVVFLCSIGVSIAILLAGAMTPKTLDISHSVDH